MAQQHTLNQFSKDDWERWETCPRREVQKEAEMWIFNPCLCSLSLGGDAGKIHESSVLRLSRGCPIPSPLALPCGHLQTLCWCIFSLPGPASFLPSVPLFMTPPCTVKPPITLPLLLLLQIYCTCRVKWLQWQGPAFFPPSPRDSLKSSPSFAFTWSCCAAYEIGRFICYLAWCLITL